MFRRTIVFAVAIVAIAGVGSLVFMNADTVSVNLGGERTYTLRLGYVILLSAFAGVLGTLFLEVLREGRWAFRTWRVQREVRHAERRRQLRDEARHLALAGNYGRARTLLSKLTRGEEPSVVDLVDIADTHLAEGDPATARKLLDDGVKTFGNDPLLLHARARACLETGDAAAAVAALERAVKTYPDSPLLHRTLRDALVAVDANDRAADAQGRVVELDPTNVVEKQRLLDLRLAAANRLEGRERTRALKALVAMAPAYIPGVLARIEDLEAGGHRRAALRLIDKTITRSSSPAFLDAADRLLATTNDRQRAKFYARAIAAHPANDDIAARARGKAPTREAAEADETDDQAAPAAAAPATESATS